MHYSVLAVLPEPEEDEESLGREVKSKKKSTPTTKGILIEELKTLDEDDMPTRGIELKKKKGIMEEQKKGIMEEQKKGIMEEQKTSANDNDSDSEDEDLPPLEPTAPKKPDTDVSEEKNDRHTFDISDYLVKRKR